MDMASDFGSEDCGFESRRGQYFSDCNFKSIMNITSNLMGLTWTWFFIPGYSQEKIISKFQSICFHLFNSRVLFCHTSAALKKSYEKYNKKLKFRATSGKIQEIPVSGKFSPRFSRWFLPLEWGKSMQLLNYFSAHVQKKLIKWIPRFPFLALGTTSILRVVEASTKYFNSGRINLNNLE